jgi:hypothetical protein
MSAARGALFGNPLISIEMTRDVVECLCRFLPLQMKKIALKAQG